jgi:hypothetical protein
MVTKIQCRRGKNQSGRGGTQQNSILEHLSPPILSRDNNDSAANNSSSSSNRGVRSTRNNNGAQRNSSTGGDGGRRQRRATSPPSLNNNQEEGDEASIMQSHPRLSRIMEEAQYEAFVDPFRGIVPFFSVSFNNDNENNTEGGGARSDEDNIDRQSPWVQCEPVLQGGCSSWKFEQAEDVHAKKVTNNKKQQQKNGSTKHQVVEVVNVDDDSTSTVALQQSNNGSNDENNVRIVRCGCPTIDSWAIEEWETYQQHLSKKNKKGGKKRKRTEVTDLSASDDTIAVNTIDEDDAENNNVNISLAAITPTLICGQRRLGGDECSPCDFNPVS